MKNTIVLPATILTLLIATAAQARPSWTGLGMESDERLDRRIEQMTERLDLTEKQQAQIRAILDAQRAKRAEERAAVRKQIDAVLTEEQRATRDARIGRRTDRAVARIADRLDLTQEQESKLQTLMTERRNDADWRPAEMRARLSSILTEEQLMELDEMRPHRRPGGRGPCKN
jgi:Spy/CpxP family protein refolding chaperone